jgi:branched-chain amino acid transport system permease protein
VSNLLQVLVGGIASGCVYALVALSFVLIYRSTGAVSFMQGELMMSGAFAALAASTWLALPWWLALLFALALMALFGAGLERLVIRRMADHPHIAVVLLTLGLGMMLKGLVTLVPDWSTRTHALPLPVSGVVSLGGAALSAEQVAIVAVTCALTFAFWLFYRHTRGGLALRACADDAATAALLGVSVPRMHLLTWALGGAMAAAAGVLLAPLTFVHPGMGTVALKAFAAAVIGGMVSLPGSFAGGLLLGVVEALAGFGLPEGFRESLVWLVLLAAMMLRPRGSLLAR